MDILTERIVVGYDGSPRSCAALDWAADEARRRALSLTVLHVIDYPGRVPTTMASSGWSATFAGDAGKIATAGAERARHHTAGIDVNALTEITGVVGALVEISKDAALLVVGTRRRDRLSGVVLGSVAFAVTARAHCPVVVVRGDRGRRAGLNRPVVVGFDDSPGSAAAVRYAADVAAETGANLTVITAYRPVAPWIRAGTGDLTRPSDGNRPDFEAIAHAAARETAIGALRIAREHHPGLPVAQRAIRGPTADILARAAERAGLLVIGSPDCDGFDDLALGGVGHRVIRSSPCPVVVVPQGLPQSDHHPVPAFVTPSA